MSKLDFIEDLPESSEHGGSYSEGTVRIIIEYGDGGISYLSGSDAVIWQELYDMQAKILKQADLPNLHELSSIAWTHVEG